MEKVSQRVVFQRGRNRLIEYLESVQLFELGEYPWDINEQLNQWEDCVGTDHPISATTYTPPVYTEEEYVSLLEVDLTWNEFCNVTPRKVELKSFSESPEGKRFVGASKAALWVFNKRGRLPEDYEI